MTNLNLLNVIQSFTCEDNDGNSPPKIVKAVSRVAKPTPSKKTRHVKRTASTESQGQALKDLRPSIRAGLTVIFVGYNPGIESSRQQHHYAHPTNLFWKLFNALGLLSALLDIRNVDCISHSQLISDIYLNGKLQARPEHDFRLIDFGVGFTDLVLRCTKQALELSLHEKTANVPRLLEEFKTSQAPFIVFVGKGIWEVVYRYLMPKHRLTAQNFSWGFQEDLQVMLRFYSFCKHKPLVYVFPNTSGLVALMKYPQKLKLWENLVADVRKREEIYN